MKEEKQERKIITESTIALLILILTILGTVIPLHMHMSTQISAIQNEMKDFHGRLVAIEERARNKGGQS